jgi:N6-adenosine-specific RNA methylase IME4
MSEIALVRYDAACRALAAAKSVDEVRKIRNTAEAMRAYAKQAKNKQLEIDAAEIRILAERRVGELIVAQRESVGLAKGAEHGGRRRKIDGARKEPSNQRPTLSEAGIDKKLSARAQQLAAVPAPAFDRLIRDWRVRIEHENERVTTNLLREGRREQLRQERHSPPLPEGHYRLIYADPPWQYEHIETESRAIENQYPTMALEDICALRVPAADDAVLFLWTTPPKVAEAMQVIDAWGFRYRTGAVWIKPSIGMGYYFRQQHEHLLVAARGTLSVPEPTRRKSSVIHARRGKHSAKPEEVYALLEWMYSAFGERDRIELFARTRRKGWSAWGNEAA